MRNEPSVPSNELSVLIPVFNADIRPLVNAIHQQCQQLDLVFEIRCYDDGSESEVKTLNQEVSAFSHTLYQELPQHLGRVAIRNKLAREARYDWLLFLDNDSQVICPDFISKYLQARIRAWVLPGGTCYQPQMPAKPYRLHWLFGSQRETIPAIRRNQTPYQSFYLNNILIFKAFFLRFPLKPMRQEYGHEDSRFGRHLQQAKIAVWHLDNPVCHAGLKPACLFLQNSREAIENLYWLYRQEGVGAETKLIRVYKQLKQYGLSWLFCLGFGALEGLVRKQLQGPAPWLWLFDLYKLYWFLLEDRKQA